MTTLQPQTGAIPLPQPTMVSRPFWDGCKRGELLFQHCNACGGATWSPALMCCHCYSLDLQWQQSKGEGEVYSWTVVWRPQTPEFTGPTRRKACRATLLVQHDRVRPRSGMRHEARSVHS